MELSDFTYRIENNRNAIIYLKLQVWENTLVKYLTIKFYLEITEKCV